VVEDTVRPMTSPATFGREGVALRRTQYTRVVPMEGRNYRMWAEVDANTSAQNDRALRVAATSANADLVRELLDANCDPNAADNVGITPLHRAAFTTCQPDTMKCDVVTLLIRAGANVEARSDSYGTPLHFAALTGARLTTSSLLAGRADANARDTPTRGNTPLHLACRDFEQDMRNLVQADGLLPTSMQEKAGRTGAGPASKSSLLCSMDAKISLEYGDEHFLQAGWADQKDVIGLVLRLLDGKADPNLANSAGTLPPRWTREVRAKMHNSTSTAAALRAFAVDRACKECLELDAAKGDGKKGKKGKKGKGGGKKRKK